MESLSALAAGNKSSTASATVYALIVKCHSMSVIATIMNTIVTTANNLNRCVDATGIADMKDRVELVIVSVLTAALLAVLLEVWP